MSAFALASTLISRSRPDGDGRLASPVPMLLRATGPIGIETAFFLGEVKP